MKFRERRLKAKQEKEEKRRKANEEKGVEQLTKEIGLKLKKANKLTKVGLSFSLLSIILLGVNSILSATGVGFLLGISIGILISAVISIAFTITGIRINKNTEKVIKDRNRLQVELTLNKLKENLTNDSESLLEEDFVEIGKPKTLTKRMLKARAEELSMTEADNDKIYGGLIPLDDEAERAYIEGLKARRKNGDKSIDPKQETGGVADID